MKDVHLIKTEEQYDAVMAEVLNLAKLNPAVDTEEYERLTILSLLVEDYDNKHYPIPECTPAEAIRFVMEQNELTAKDMTPYFGTTSRFYEVVNGKRNLTLSMIKKLHNSLGISYNSLMA